MATLGAAYLTSVAEITASSETAVPMWSEESQENFQMERKPNMIKNGIWKGKLHALVIAASVLATVIILFSGCSADTYTQTIKITVESLSPSGLVAEIEYYRDSERVNYIRFCDWDGDSVIDGKSRPSEEGLWPKGWEYFDDIYGDVTVGHSTITVVGDGITIQNGISHEFLTGEYECKGGG